jgi:hypothetical protein
MIYKYLTAVISALMIFPAGSECQTAWYYQWGLLPDKTIDLFIGKSSGERAFNTIMDISEYNRQRSQSEFSGTLYESDYIIARLREYGLSDITIERFGKVSAWRPLSGELFEVSPRFDKIADIRDLPFVLNPGSPNTDIEAELVYIGDAYTGDLDLINLKGKIVLTSARPGAVINMLIQKEAAGIISYYSPRPLDNCDMIPDMKGGGYSRSRQQAITVFSISPREGSVLRDRLLDGEEIKVHMLVRFRTEEFDLQVPVCTIPGSDPQAGEIIISAHLFEGYGVQGANDNGSGSATILEAARVISELIREQKIEKPKRTIRFIWVPEYSGTIPWTRAHRDIIKKTLCNINLDMVGLSLSSFRSFFILHRTSYGNAHYVNDVIENYFRYTGENNNVNSVITGSRFFKPVVAPSGTNDPFYYQIESSSGGSDHDIFNDLGVGVPGVLLITWPDPFYHTSEDRADKCDPTQLKRAAFITAVSGYTIASAGENEAINIAGEVYGNAVRRLGYRLSMAFDRINKSGADQLVNTLKRALAEIRGVAAGEAMTLGSVNELAPSSERFKELLRDKSGKLSDFSESLAESLIETAQIRAADFRMPPVELQPSQQERRAMNLIPEITKDPRDFGYEGYTEKLRELPVQIKERYSYSAVPDPAEAAACINGSNSIMTIKYILDAQYNTETSVEGLINYFSQLREAGIIKF